RVAHTGHRRIFLSPSSDSGDTVSLRGPTLQYFTSRPFARSNACFVCVMPEAHGTARDRPPPLRLKVLAVWPLLACDKKGPVRRIPRLAGLAIRSARS